MTLNKTKTTNGVSWKMQLNFKNETWTIATNENTHIHIYMEKTHTHFDCFEGLKSVEMSVFKWPLQREDNTQTIYQYFSGIFILGSLFKCKYHPMDVPFGFLFRKWSSFKFYWKIDFFPFVSTFIRFLLFFSFCKHLSATISLMWIQNIRNMYLLLSLDKIYSIYSL